MPTTYLKLYLTLFLLLTPPIHSKFNPKSESKTSKSVNQFTSDAFDVESYISVKDKDQWDQYIADFNHDNSGENAAVWKTVNPIVCYLAVRLFPLEYVDEVQKVFARIRFSSNCGNRRDVVFLSPIVEDHPYDSREHPKSIKVLVCTI